MAYTTKRRRPRPRPNTTGSRACAECHAEAYSQHAAWCRKSE